jgi:hypothetical protein
MNKAALTVTHENNVANRIPIRRWLRQATQTLLAVAYSRFLLYCASDFAVGLSMECPFCKAEASEGSRFCVNCGARMHRVRAC